MTQGVAQGEVRLSNQEPRLMCVAVDNHWSSPQWTQSCARVWHGRWAVWRTCMRLHTACISASSLSRDSQAPALVVFAVLGGPRSSHVSPGTLSCRSSSSAQQLAQGPCPQPVTASPACSAAACRGGQALPLHALPCSVPSTAASSPWRHAACASGVLQPCAAAYSSRNF